MLPQPDVEHPYPTDLLRGGIRSALMLFCSGFGGINDCAHVREAGLRKVTGVDLDSETLYAMVDTYPTFWSFILDDAFLYCRRSARRDLSWDLVSADLPSSMPLEMIDALPLFCAVARKYVVSTIMRHNFPWQVDLSELPPAPRGWRYRDLMPRSEYRGGVYWLITERA